MDRPQMERGASDPIGESREVEAEAIHVLKVLHPACGSGGASRCPRAMRQAVAHKLAATITPYLANVRVRQYRLQRT